MLSWLLNTRGRRVQHDQMPASRGGIGMFGDLLGYTINPEGETAAGIDVDETVALSLSAVYQAIRILSEGLGSLPCITYERTATGRERAESHPNYKLLHRRPNPEQTPMVFMRTMMSRAVGWQNAYAVIEPNANGRPKNLWPIHPRRVTPQRSAEGVLFYEVQNEESGESVPVLAEEMIHVSGFSFDEFGGNRVIDCAKETIAGGIAAEKFFGAFFGNGAQPGLVLEHPGHLGDEGRKNLETSIASGRVGATKAFRVLVLEEGIKTSTVDIPLETLQFLELRRFTVEEIARWFNVPVHLLREMTNSSVRANITQEDLEFVKYSLRPWAVLFEQEFDRKLLSESEQETYFAEFLLDALLRGDYETRMNGHAVAIERGLRSVNDIGKLENWNDIGPQGDLYRFPLNMAPAQDVVDGKVTFKAAPTNGEGDKKKLGGEKDAVEELPDLQAERRKAIESFRAMFVDIDERLLRKEVRLIKQSLKRFESTADTDKLRAWLEKLYGDQCDAMQQMCLPLRELVSAAARAVVPLDRIAEKHTASCCAAVLRGVIEGDGAESSRRIRGIFEAWKETRPTAAAEELLRAVANCAAQEQVEMN